jgi:hypothetical protein
VACAFLNGRVQSLNDQYLTATTPGTAADARESIETSQSLYTISAVVAGVGLGGFLYSWNREASY